MAYSNFKPLVWSKHIQRELEKATVLQEDCNTEFEGEARQGSRVKILGVARPTIGDYTGQNIGAPEDVPDTAVYLDIDRAKFFNFGVDDVDKAQSVEGLMQALMAESAAGLAQERDRYIASLAKDAADRDGRRGEISARRRLRLALEQRCENQRRGRHHAYALVL